MHPRPDRQCSWESNRINLHSIDSIVTPQFGQKFAHGQIWYSEGSESTPPPWSEVFSNLISLFDSWSTIWPAHGSSRDEQVSKKLSISVRLNNFITFFYSTFICFIIAKICSCSEEDEGTTAPTDANHN